MRSKRFVFAVTFGLLLCGAMSALAGDNDLHTAAKNGDVETVQQLLDAGVPIDATDQEGWTPLVFASSNGHKAVVQLLLAAGADIATTDKQGHTPLMFAAKHGHGTVAQLLLAAGVAADATNHKGWSALMSAALNGHETVVKLLIDSGAAADATDNESHTPLMVAAQNGHETVVKLLIDLGANVSTTTHQGWSALMIAAQNGHETVAKLLIDSGANVKATNNEGFTPLRIAVHNSRLSICQILLDVPSIGSDTQLLGQTLDEAAAWGRTSVIQLLLSHCSSLKKTYAYQMNAAIGAFPHKVSTARLILQSIAERIKQYQSHSLARALHAIAFTQDDLEFNRLFAEFINTHHILGRWNAETAHAIRKGKLKQLTLILELGLVRPLWLLINTKDVSTQIFALVLDYCDIQTLQRTSPSNEIELLLEDLMHKQRPKIAQMLVMHAHRNIALHKLGQEARENLLTEIVSGIATEATDSRGARLVSRLPSRLRRKLARSNHHAELLRSLAERGLVKKLGNAHQAAIQSSSVGGGELLTEVKSTIAQRQQLVCEHVGGTRDLEQLISGFEGAGL